MELGDRLDVVVRPSRAAVADDQRRTQRVGIEVADDAVPGLVAVALEVALHDGGTYPARDARPLRVLAPLADNVAQSFDRGRANPLIHPTG